MNSLRLAGLTTLVTLLVVGCAGGEGAAGDETDGPIDGALVEQGEALFTSNGCNACHTVGGGRLVGPDLAGVSERREYSFIAGMITNPDSMLANDETAKALLGEYLTPMANQDVTRDEARALYEYFRSNDSDTAAQAGGQ